MIENTIAKRYARALLSVALDISKSQVDILGAELLSFDNACQANPALMPTLTNRYFDLFARERIIADLAKKMSLSQTTAHFLQLLIHKSRIALFPIILKEYQTLAHDVMGRAVMTVVSSTELSDAQYQNLETLFGGMTGKKMVVERRTQPEVLGGLRVHIKDEVYDYTVAHQLEKMKQQMLGAI